MHDVAALLGVLIWPVTVLVIVVFLRGEIKNLLGRVREFTGPGNVRAILDPNKVSEIIAKAQLENASPQTIAERLAQSATIVDQREARILRGLLDDDGRWLEGYQSDYYKAAFDSLIKQGYVVKEGRAFSLTPLGKKKTKEYLEGVLRRMDDQS